MWRIQLTPHAWPIRAPSEPPITAIFTVLQENKSLSQMVEDFQSQMYTASVQVQEYKEKKGLEAREQALQEDVKLTKNAIRKAKAREKGLIDKTKTQ